MIKEVAPDSVLLRPVACLICVEMPAGTMTSLRLRVILKVSDYDPYTLY